MDGFKDERFSFIANDPRFRSIPKVHRRIKIDKRFQSMFTDKNFQLNYRIDKRGRPINETQSENFKKYYELSSSDEEPNEGIGEAGTNDNLNTSKSFSESEEELLSSENKDKTSVSDEEFTDHLINKTKQFTDSEYEDETDLAYKAKMTDKIKSRLKDDSLDYARGIGVLLSDSSSDESSSEVSDDENFEHGWGELDKNTEKTDEATRRFAVCHMDWDRINATDIMVLFHSFLPAEGVIQSVTVRNNLLITKSD
ncbi:hypothetical protein AAG570_011489 [Ranatra chinensis]|uniref:ESF1 RRM domain-containing protein n=1 Tax=Ranatra chinensis TaxID=642074 RepID=A0ABD0Z2Z0_9HEMI